jgi:Cof subfamily protein (haloacid dehalogenase superfamily)
VRVRMVATDLDGTLLRSDGTVSAYTSQVLRAAAAAGVAVVPATARRLRWLDGYAFAAGLAHAVFANGAVVYDVGAQQVIARHLLPPDTVAELCDRISTALPPARFAVETDDGMAMWHEPDYPLRSDLGQPGVAPALRAELVTRPATKLLVKAPGVDPDRLLAEAVAAAGSEALVSDSAPYGLAEFAAAGVSKASGLAAVAARLGVTPDEVVAFGDMRNDLPMLAWAGRAVAVANAHPDVLSAAHVIADSNDDDGVARWLAAMLSLD